MALSSNKKPNVKSSKKKELLEIIELSSKSVLVETKDALLFELGDYQIWFPKNKCWINSVLISTFKVPVYEKDEFNYRVITPNCKDGQYEEFSIYDIADEIKSKADDYKLIASIIETK